MTKLLLYKTLQNLAVFLDFIKREFTTVYLQLMNILKLNNKIFRTLKRPLTNGGTPVGVFFLKADKVEIFSFQ